MDMKGQGVAQLVAFLRLKRENVPRTRDVILLAEPDEEVGGALGARWMIANHYAELDPEYVIDEGGFGSRDLFAPNKLVYGISVAEKKIVWLKLRAEGVAGHGSQPTDTNPNDRLVKALARLLGAGQAREPQASGDRSAPSARARTVRARHDAGEGRRLREEQVHQRDPAVDDLADLVPLRRRRSAEDQRHPVGRRSRPRLPRAAGHDARISGSPKSSAASAIRRSRSS